MGYERYDTFPKVLYLLQVVYMSEQAGSDIMLYMISKIFQHFTISEFGINFNTNQTTTFFSCHM